MQFIETLQTPQRFCSLLGEKLPEGDITHIALLENKVHVYMYSFSKTIPCSCNIA